MRQEKPATDRTVIGAPGVNPLPRGGHLFLITHAAEVAPQIEEFLAR